MSCNAVSDPSPIQLPEYPEVVRPWTGRRYGRDALSKAQSLSRAHRERAENVRSISAFSGFARSLEEALRKCVITINVKSPADVYFIIHPESSGYLSGFEYQYAILSRDNPHLAEEQRIESAVAAHKDRLKDWYTARQETENALLLGPDAKYAAYTPDGSSGVTHYGDICLVVEPDPSVTVTYFDGDTAESSRTAVDQGFRLDEAYLDDRFATKDSLADAFVANRVPSLANTRATNTTDWFADHVTRVENCVELHIHGQVRPSDIRHVRFARRICDRLARTSRDAPGVTGTAAHKYVDPAAWLGRILMLLGKDRVHFEGASQ